MKPISSYFTRGPAEAKSSELAAALAEAEAERQRLRERQQALVASRQDVLLTGTDDELDAIEAELTGIQRATERLDLRIPELRRIRDERRAAERTASEGKARDAALKERLAIADAIDARLAELEALFARLEGTAVTLRGIDHVRVACTKLGGPMRDLVPDPDAIRMAMVAHGPHLAKALSIEPFGGMRPGSYREHEDRAWDLALHGKGGAIPRPPEMPPVPEDALDAAERQRSVARRYG